MERRIEAVDTKRDIPSNFVKRRYPKMEPVDILFTLQPRAWRYNSLAFGSFFRCPIPTFLKVFRARCTLIQVNLLGLGGYSMKPKIILYLLSDTHPCNSSSRYSRNFDRERSITYSALQTKKVVTKFWTSPASPQPQIFNLRYLSLPQVFFFRGSVRRNDYRESRRREWRRSDDRGGKGGK